jgi:hypothetical protein
MASCTVSSTGEARTVVAEHLARPATAWAIGMVGAVAEFMRAPVERTDGDDLTSVVTTRGGLRIEATSDTRVVRFSLASDLLASHCVCRKRTLASTGAQF